MGRFKVSLSILAASSCGHGVFGTPASDDSSSAFVTPSALIPRALPRKKSLGRLRLSSRRLFSASSASNNHVGHSVALVDEETKAAIARQDALLHRRTLLNYILVSAAAGGAAAMLSQPSQPANAFPFGPSAASLEGPKTTEALDRAGQPIVASQFLATKSGGERTMVQGLKSDPTYLIVTAEGGGLEPYAINAECTHLGCLVPWDPIQKKFECPCHGSQYDARGSVIRGPAPGPLKLAKVSTEEETGCILLENWSDADFRTGEKPWWV